MNSEPTYQGQCFFGAVQFSVNGEPAAMGYCHCQSCRQWSAAPVNAFTLWQPEALTVIRGAGNIGSYNKAPRSSRKWCKNCGGHLFTEHPEMALVDVYAALAPQLAYTPEVHAHYLEAVVHVKDGLAKLQDVPVEMGGSGLNSPAILYQSGVRSRTSSSWVG